MVWKQRRQLKKKKRGRGAEGGVTFHLDNVNLHEDARTSNSVAALLEPGIKHTVSDNIQRTKAASFTCFHPAKKIDEDEVSTVS